jgi:hypothetical protein
MSVPPTTILLAIASPLIRRTLSMALQHATGFAVVGETGDPVAAVQLARQLKADILLCDDGLAFDPTFATQAPLLPEPGRSRIVLVTVNPGSARPLSSSFAAVIPLTNSPSTLAVQLHEVMDVQPPEPPAPEPPPVLEMGDRFTVPGQSPAREHGAGTGKHARPDTFTMPGDTSAGGAVPARQVIRRGRPERRTEQLTEDQRMALLRLAPAGARQPLHDSTIGLPTVHVLELALLALPNLNVPAAVVVVGLSYPQDVTPAAATRTAIIRTCGAVLRANVRQEDLVCYLDDHLAFAVVMLGIDQQTIAVPVRRIQDAMRHFTMGRNLAATPHVALGTGFWQTGMAPEYPLQCSWQAMLRERSGGTGT